MYSEITRLVSSGRLQLRKRPRPVAFSSLCQNVSNVIVGRQQQTMQHMPRHHPRRPLPEFLPSNQASSRRRYQSTSSTSRGSGGSGRFAPHAFSSVSISTSVRDDNDEVDYDADDVLCAGYLQRLPSSSSSQSSPRYIAASGNGSPGGSTSSLFWQRSPTSHDDTDVSSLELELGEASIWDAPSAAASVAYDDGDSAGELDDDEEEDSATLDGGPSVEHDASAVPMPDHDHDHGRPDPHRRRPRRRSAVELLAQFDAQRPPKSDDPLDLQLWLECEAQQEAVLRYQKLIDQARNRKDYGSMSLVQRQILRWYPALLAEISHRQRDYVLKRTSAKHYKSAKRYGPYLCALPAEKMAVICAHEAILHSLLKSGLHGRDGVPFVGLACRLGAAVEEEVLVHGALHKRWIQASKRQHSVGGDGSDAAEDEMLLESLVETRTADGVETVDDPEGDEDDDYDDSDDDHVKEPTHPGHLDSPSDAFGRATHQWSYTSSHLKTFLDEINQRQPSAKKRRVIAYAVRRARLILEKEEEWTTEERVHLGVALFQILLEKATISYDGKEEMAFTYEKRWCHKKNKLKSYVKLNERLYDMVVSDKLQSFHATTTRYKPMIIPPKPWQAINSGAYRFLRSDLIRYHGSNMQKVRAVAWAVRTIDIRFPQPPSFLCEQEALMNADLSTVYNGLNALGRVPWRINRKVLATAQRCWDENIPLGDVRSLEKCADRFNSTQAVLLAH